MIITRTPYRISFFGGGTDYPVWFQENEGAVLSTTINKYCYISLRSFPPFFKHKSRVVWSKIEEVSDNREIEHPSVKACLEFLKIDSGISIHHEGDLPARSGLGSSSSFTVGLLHALYGLKGSLLNKQRLAEEAIHVEQEILKENVGCQDQIIAAYGGLNKITFASDKSFFVSPMTLPRDRIESLGKHLMLIFTGLNRSASDIAKKQIELTPAKKSELKTMHQMVEEGIAILKGQDDIDGFGRLLHESWQLKRSLTDKISNPLIDEIYEVARRNGATGGKLLGAGGGGFVLLFAKPEHQDRIREKLSTFLHVPIRFENQGSQIIFYEPNH